MKRDEEFFVGYLPMPAALRPRMRTMVGFLFAGFVAAALALAVAQHGFARSVFEFGMYRPFEGLILERPYPMLLVARPGKASDAQGFSTYLLVDQFKHGANAQVRGLEGKTIRLQAQVIYRDEGTMLELRPGSIQEQPAAGHPFDPKMKNLGRLSITGELADTKCLLGVMNPGSGKVHRDCAARCVSGGVPLGLVTRDSEGHGQLYLVSSVAHERSEKALLDRVGEVLTVKGDGVELNGQKFILIR